MTKDRIACDLAGFGASQLPAGDDLRAEMVATASGVLADTGGCRARIICQSLGGWTGARLTAPF